MSTTGKRDDAGDPGKTGMWKAGFNLECGVPSTLLVPAVAKGPWVVVENPRATKNRFYVARGLPQSFKIADVVDLVYVTALITDDGFLAGRIAERLNGWEMSRDFPPRAVIL